MAKHDKTILNSHYSASDILMPLTTKYDDSLSRDQIYFINIHCAIGPHTIAIAITGSTADNGTTSETPRLDITAEMPVAHTDISVVSSRLEASHKCLGNAVISSCATLIDDRKHRCGVHDC